MSGGELESLVRRWNEKLVAADDAAAWWPKHLVSDDDVLAFEGADGLRDFRSQKAAPALLAVVNGGADDDDVVACAAHALVSMQAPEAAAALEILARSPSESLRRLAELWR